MVTEQYRWPDVLEEAELCLGIRESPHLEEALELDRERDPKSRYWFLGCIFEDSMRK